MWVEYPRPLLWIRINPICGLVMTTYDEKSWRLNLKLTSFFQAQQTCQMMYDYAK